MNIRSKSFVDDLFFIETLASPKLEPSKKALTKFFDKFSTPTKNYSLRTKHGIKKIALTLPPSAKKTTEVLYRWKRNSTGEKLIGETTTISGRLSSYLTSFRHPKKDIGKGELPRAVQENAKLAQKGKAKEDFSFGILLTKEDLPKSLQHLSIGQIEKYYIDYEKEKGTPLFNKRNGGGGGAGRAKNENPPATKEEVKKFVKSLTKTYRSPKKTYPINPKTLKVELSPSAKGNLYVFKRKKITKIKYNKTEEVSCRYIGKTERPKITSRMAEHSSHARNTQKEMSKKPLYKDIRNHPEQFQVQLIDTKQFKTNDLDLIENGLIQFYQEKKEPLYNKNKGGGGGHARNS